jgi:hypothetical protein
MGEIPPYPGTPRWVKVFGLLAVLVALTFVHRMLTGGGGHGRHAPAQGDAHR